MSIKLELTTEQAQILLQVSGKLLDALYCPAVEASTSAPAAPAPAVAEKKVIKRRRRRTKNAPKEEIVLDVPEIPIPKRARRKKTGGWKDALKAPD